MAKTNNVAVSFHHGPTPAKAREALAAYAHEAWSGWMRYLFSLSTRHPDGSVTIPPDLVARWERQMTTSYDQLPAHEQESDRVEADRMLAIVTGRKPA